MFENLLKFRESSECLWCFCTGPLLSRRMGSTGSEVLEGTARREDGPLCRHGQVGSLSVKPWVTPLSSSTVTARDTKSPGRVSWEGQWPEWPKVQLQPE